MKKIICVIVTVALMLMALTASAETTISVSGVGETRVSADTAIVTLGVNCRDRDVKNAQQVVNEKIASIREALIGLGIEEECINTDYINIYTFYDYVDDREQMSYNASSSLCIKVTDIEMTGAVIDTAFSAGANILDGISFSASDTDAAEKDSLTKAVADAREKAEILADASGLKITGIALISEGFTHNYANAVSNFAADTSAEKASAASGTEVRAAKVVVTANVSITFTAE